MSAERQLVEINPPQSSAVLTPMDMIDKALASGAGIETLERLMALQERYEKNQAKKAFDEAVASAKAELGQAEKNATGHNNKRYANFAAYASAVDPVISKYGLSYRFRSTQTDRISVTCILSHKAGHSEENTLTGPPDKTGSKNDIQAIGSTLTYLQRYSLIQALGLAAADDDDGKGAGRKDEGGTVSGEQIKTLLDLIEQTSTDIEQFCRAFTIEAIPDMRAADFDRAVILLNKKAKRK